MVRQWLKDLRKEKGLTFKELAERVGCSEIYVVSIQQGTRKRHGLDTGFVCKIAEATGTDAMKLLRAEMAWCEEVADG